VPRKKPGTVSSTLACTRPGSSRSSPAPSLRRAWLKPRSNFNSRNSSAARPLGRMLTLPSIAAPRHWCCRCTERKLRTACVPRSVKGVAQRLALGLREAHEILVSQIRPQADRLQSSRTSPALSLRRDEMVISGRSRVSAEDSTRRSCASGGRALRLGDQAFAQQHLDVAVVAGAIQHLCLAQLINAAIADMRPISRRVLHQTQPRRWRAGALPAQTGAVASRLLRAPGPRTNAKSPADRKSRGNGSGDGPCGQDAVERFSAFPASLNHSAARLALARRYV